MRILAREHAHQQLVQVKPAKQGLAAQETDATHPLRPGEGLDLAPSHPAERQGLKRHQRAAHRRARPARALGHKHDPALNSGECLDQQAGLLVGIAVQDVAFAGLAHCIAGRLPPGLSHIPFRQAAPRCRSSRPGPSPRLRGRPCRRTAFRGQGARRWRPLSFSAPPPR